MPEIPGFLRERLVEQFGAEIEGEIEKGFAARRPVTLRVNPLRAERAAVLAQLDAAGVAYERVPWYEDALILPFAREDAIQALPLYARGEVYLQGLSAMLPPLLLAPKEGETVLDMAAAPGGKTTQMAALSGGKALITACEKNKLRAERLTFNLNRQGAGRVMVMNQDARELDDFFSFDKILLDAPCTGSGTVCLLEGEAQRRMDEAWVKKTVATQRAMLQKALRLLSPGHEMVYATCSILRMENEDVVRTALRGGAELVPIEDKWASALPLLPASLPGTLTVCPTALYEGFFVAKLRKKKK